MRTPTHEMGGLKVRPLRGLMSFATLLTLYRASGSSHLRHFLRLSRLALAVCQLYLWLVALAEHVITHQLTHEVDPSDRRDLSLLRLGWDFLERRLALFDPIPPVALPNFCLMSGGYADFW